MNRNNAIESKEILPSSSVWQVLKWYPEVEKLIVEAAPAFKALKNPLLRNTMAKVTTLQRAAEIGNIEVLVWVNSMRKVVGQTPLSSVCPDTDLAVPFSEENKELPNKPLKISYDVRPMLEQGIHPKEMIIEAAAKLTKEERLEFITGFVPTPLIDLLRAKGFQTQTIIAETGEVHTSVCR